MATSTLSGIYAIRNRTTGGMYIGSAVHVPLRWTHHRKRLRKGTHHSNHLQRAWNKYGESDFDLVTLEEVADVADLIEREQHWINAHKPTTKLYNICQTAGSSLGRRHSDLAKARMRAMRSTPEARLENRARQLGQERSAETKSRHRATLDTPECRMRFRLAQLGRKATPEAIERNRLGQLGRKHSEETKAKMRANGIGRQHTADSKLKISLSKKGKKLGPFSPEHIAKIRVAKTGVRLSEETKAKLRLKARLRAPMSAETRAKISAAHKGRGKTPEHIAKIEAAKRAKREATKTSVQLSFWPKYLHQPKRPEERLQRGRSTQF